MGANQGWIGSIACESVGSGLLLEACQALNANLCVRTGIRRAEEPRRREDG